MLARPSPALYSVRGSFAQRPGKHGLSASVRLNSSLASESNTPKDSAAKSTGTNAKRSIPKAFSVGDIVIPAHNGKPTVRFSSQNQHFSPDLSWLGDDEFDGGARFASRLARRQANTRAQSASTSIYAHPPQDGELSFPIPLPVTPRGGGDQARNTQRAHGEQKSAGLVDRRRTTEGTARVEEWQNRRRPGTLGNRNGQPQRGDRDRRQQPRNDASQAQRQSSARVQRAESKVRAQPEKAPTLAEPSSPPVPLNLHIQTTDLGKLFGQSATARSVDIKPSSHLSSPSTRRVRSALEEKGGDYSRFLPTDLDTELPERLGPLGTARIIMGKKREAGMRQRRHALGIVQQLVVQKVVDTGSEMTA